MNEGDNQIIESGPKILENIPTDDGEIGRDGVGFNDVINELSRFRISLSADLIRLRFFEGIKSRLEFLDVCIGPLDLF
jgi:hypothetical protein